MSPVPALPYRRILLTGGNGFVGGHLAPLLAAATPEALRVMLVRPGSPAPADGWTAAQAEIDDEAAVAAIVRTLAPDLVLHLAAQSSVEAGHGAADATWRVNLGGALAVGRACAAFAPRATILLVGSGEVYGRSFDLGPATEETPLAPLGAYARSKAAAEWALGDVLGAEARLIVARPFNHTGVGQDERFVLPSFATQIARVEAGRQTAIRVGNLDASRDFLDVSDVCAAYLAILAAAPRLPERSLFNVASGRPRRIGDLLDAMTDRSPRRIEVAADPSRMRPADVAVATGSGARLAGLCGWSPRVALEDTLLALLEDARRRLRAPCGESARCDGEPSQ